MVVKEKLQAQSGWRCIIIEELSPLFLGSIATITWIVSKSLINQVMI